MAPRVVAATHAHYTVDAEYLFAGTAPFALTPPVAVSAIENALDLPRGGVRLIRASVSAQASVRIPGASYESLGLADGTLSRAFARASNISDGAVSLDGFSPARRKTLAADTARFAVSLDSLDAAQELYLLYAHGNGNVSVAREFTAAGVRCGVAHVSLGGADASVEVEADVPPDVAAERFLEKMNNATVIEAINAAMPPGVTARAGRSPVVVAAPTRPDPAAFAAFATAPAVGFAAYVIFARVKRRMKPQTLPKTVKKLKL